MLSLSEAAESVLTRLLLRLLVCVVVSFSTLERHGPPGLANVYTAARSVVAVAQQLAPEHQNVQGHCYQLRGCRSVAARSVVAQQMIA